MLSQHNIRDAGHEFDGFWMQFWTLPVAFNSPKAISHQCSISILVFESRIWNQRILHVRSQDFQRVGVQRGWLQQTGSQDINLSSRAHYHCLLHYVIKIHQCYRWTDEHHAYSIGVTWHTACHAENHPNIVLFSLSNYVNKSMTWWWHVTETHINICQPNKKKFISDTKNNCNIWHIQLSELKATAGWQLQSVELLVPFGTAVAEIVCHSPRLSMIETRNYDCIRRPLSRGAA